MLKKQYNQDKKDKEIEELTNKWKRALADYQNLEKRIHEERQKRAQYAAARVIEKILSSIDDLERSERHIKDQGLSLAIKSLHDVLISEGVRRIEVVGKQFNPVQMECIEIVEGDKDNIVTQEIRPGYLLEDKIIRVARVKVSKLKNKEEQKWQKS
ncbi:nucleotide exchange factor GrpE [Candidatus Gottesmanbacteria bacterium]|nr:nucleotide exchange factor GrpE [Candidatus Gottesmanbacteria bacterium]